MSVRIGGLSGGGRAGAGMAQSSQLWEANPFADDTANRQPSAKGFASHSYGVRSSERDGIVPACGNVL
jgi:hypothetical protein